MMIRKSIHSDALRTYHSSNSFFLFLGYELAAIDLRPSADTRTNR